MLSSIDPSLETQHAVSMKIDVHLMGKKTGVLYVEGIFEPIDVDKGTEAEKQQEMLRALCRSIGKSLSVKAKSAKSSTDALSSSNTEVPNRKLVPGRLEIHLICVRRGDPVSAENALVAHLWLNSSMEDRKEMKSKVETSKCSVDGIEGGDIVWDRQTTLYAKDISTELLRVEILTLT